jgi:hypothetical protein
MGRAEPLRLHLIERNTHPQLRRLPGSLAAGQSAADHPYLSLVRAHLPFPIKKGRAKPFTLPSKQKSKKTD